MFRHYRIIFRELVFITSQSYISIPIAAVGITNSCNLNTYVTLRGNEYEFPEDETIASRHAGA